MIDATPTSLPILNVAVAVPRLSVYLYGYIFPICIQSPFSSCVILWNSTNENSGTGFSVESITVAVIVVVNILSYPAGNS